MKLSIIIPVFNEERTIEKVIKKVLEKDFRIEKEVIVVNDGSVDKTEEILNKIKNKEKILVLISYSKNQGKGFAIRKGIEVSKGDIIAIQDADLEYDLEDLKNLVNSLIKENLKVVYGSRFLKKNKYYKINSFYLANRFLSFLTSIFYFQRITDMETCYKVFRKEVIRNLELNSTGFEIEPEITSKILKAGYRIKEIPIKYKPRTKKEGKKIRWKDGFIAIWTLARERFTH